MDAVGAIASVVSVVVECGKLIFSPIYLHTKNFFRLQSNLEALEQKKITLKELKEKVELEVEAAGKNGNVATPQVKEWLRDVEKVMSVADPMQPDMTDNNSGCFLNCSLSRKVTKTLKEVQRLSGADCPVDIVAINHEATMVEHVPGFMIEDQTAASRNLTKLMKMLNQNEATRIGIWGMGGVGKTTLVKNLNNHLKSSSSAKCFGKVIWTTVSKDTSLRRVQAQIAESLNLSVGERDEQRMAIRLYQRLKKEAKFLLILDDVWEAIDLNDLGIPMTEDCTGCKILITSRSKEVCSLMKMDVGFKVEVLLDGESEKLFEKHAGEVVNLKEIKPFAKEIVKECGGLPLAIITLGAAMRRKENVVLWEDALNGMRRSSPSTPGIEKKVFNSLKWSYDSLQGTDIKSIFLYCCLYPEDFSIPIKELVECWVMEGSMEQLNNYEDSFKHGIALVERLKDACLLEVGARDYTSSEETVVMHDIVRDVAIWMTSNEKEGCESLVQAGIGLTDISKLKFTKSLKRVSLMKNNIKRLPTDTAQPECLQVSTLFLQGNVWLEEIGDGFLQRFSGLKVLNMSCTGIKYLPQGLENMTRLRVLDISWTPYLRHIPAGVICKLSCLEVLEMEDSAYQWGVRKCVQEREASIEELGCVNKVCELTIRIESESIGYLNSADLSWMSRLTRFQIFIGDSTKPVPDQDKLVRVSNTNLSKSRIEGLLAFTNCLLLNSCKGLDRMIEKLAMKCNAPFYALKKLIIKCCEESAPSSRIIIAQTLNIMYSYVSTTAQFDLLPNLEVLKLLDVLATDNILEFLVSRFRLKLSKLRSLTVKNCGEMKYLFTVGDSSLIQILGNLEKIELGFCFKLEGVIQDVGVRKQRQQGDDPVVLLPKLQEVKIEACPRLKKLPLSIHNANTMTEISGEKDWWNQLEWDDAAAKDSLNHLFTPFQLKIPATSNSCNFARSTIDKL